MFIGTSFNAYWCMSLCVNLDLHKMVLNCSWNGIPLKNVFLINLTWAIESSQHLYQLCFFVYLVWFAEGPITSLNHWLFMELFKSNVLSPSPMYQIVKKKWDTSQPKALLYVIFIKLHLCLRLHGLLFVHFYEQTVLTFPVSPKKR